MFPRYRLKCRGGSWSVQRRYDYWRPRAVCLLAHCRPVSESIFYQAVARRAYLQGRREPVHTRFDYRPRGYCFNTALPVSSFIKRVPDTDTRLPWIKSCGRNPYAVICKATSGRVPGGVACCFQVIPPSSVCSRYVPSFFPAQPVPSCRNVR